MPCLGIATVFERGRHLLALFSLHIASGNSDVSSSMLLPDHKSRWEEECISVLRNRCWCRCRCVAGRTKLLVSALPPSAKSWEAAPTKSNVILPRTQPVRKILCCAKSDTSHCQPVQLGTCSLNDTGRRGNTQLSVSSLQDDRLKGGALTGCLGLR